MTAFNNREVQKVNAADNGGKGFFLRERLVDGDDLGKYVKTFARITILPGTEMAYHQHVDDFEFYYFLEGEGEYNENGTWHHVKAGDVYKCNDGEWHTVKNTGDTDLSFLALIVSTL